MAGQLGFFDQTKETWLKLARLEAIRIAMQRGEVDADAIHAALPIPHYIDSRIMGKVFYGKVFEFVRYKKSERSTCHHRPIGVFRIKNTQLV